MTHDQVTEVYWRYGAGPMFSWPNGTVQLKCALDAGTQYDGNGTCTVPCSHAKIPLRVRFTARPMFSWPNGIGWLMQSVSCLSCKNTVWWDWIKHCAMCHDKNPLSVRFKTRTSDQQASTLTTEAPYLTAFYSISQIYTVTRRGNHLAFAINV